MNTNQYEFTINDKGQYHYDLTRLDEYQNDGWLIKDTDVDPDDVGSESEGGTNEEIDELDMNTIRTTHVTVDGKRQSTRVRKTVVQIYVPGDEDMVDDYDKKRTYEDSDEEGQHECNHNRDEQENFSDDVSGDGRGSSCEDDGYEIVNTKEADSSDYEPEEDSSSDESNEGGDCNQMKITQYTRK
eukprot:scaffold249344_cov41-Cyclotella_meneghiniana.AAC.2